MAGAGIAGLTFALSLPFPARIMLVTKGALGESNTRYAQGGLAAAVDEMDDPDLHLADTITAGAGLVDAAAARALVADGKSAVDWLIEQGTRFDEEGGRLALGREGAHSRSRVLHAGGDATGAEIERALVARIASRHDLTILEHTTMIDLRVASGVCTGAELVSVETGRRISVASAVTVLALGGAGRLWAVSSNPLGATGDGIAIALRRGVTCADLEFTQFHPTVLDLPGEGAFLISEAVRGDGAFLRNDDGERFMVDLDPRTELASRDIVARAIQAQIAGGSRVWLDLRHLDPHEVRRRFPTIDRHLRGVGIDMATDLIPVAPAAHYFMGGIAASPEGRTSMPGLLAIGEVSCTGVHGANRLASNSLLEGLVFGRLAAQALSPRDLVAPDPAAGWGDPIDIQPDAAALEIQQRVKTVMRDEVSVVRSATSLDHAIAVLDTLAGDPALDQPSLDATATAGMVTLAREITVSARNRHESRGGQFRSDYPEPDPSLDGRHQLVTRRADGTFDRTFGSLASALVAPAPSRSTP